MRKLILALTLLFGLTTFSQGLSLDNSTPKEIKYERGRYYVNGIQIPSYKMKKVFAPNLHSVKLYKEAKSKESIGGLVLGVGTAMSVVDLAIGLFSDVKYPTALTYIGVAAIAVSIPILSGRRAKIEEAVKSYNDQLKNASSSESNYDINAVANQNGFGFQIKF